MTQHQGLPVKGYKPQDQARVATVNENKEIEEQILRRLDDMAKHPDHYDGRWTAIARTDFEKAFMAMNRAIFRPARISLSTDHANLFDKGNGDEAINAG